MNCDLAERNRAIVAAAKAGEKRQAIADRYGLSRVRINRIVAANSKPGRKKGQKIGAYKQDRLTHLYSRIRYLPTQIANLEAKLAAVKAEARSYGLVV
ncbi:MAG: hypothetical protein KG075_17235 [Alphaproteobacteria bacterium]|nr:hypothetical protein [Alphaproteobacteria bacterium]